jgi:hypothetical protein
MHHSSSVQSYSLQITSYEERDDDEDEEEVKEVREIANLNNRYRAFLN